MNAMEKSNEKRAKQEKLGRGVPPLLTWQMLCRRLHVLPCWQLHLLPLLDTSSSPALQTSWIHGKL